MKRHPTHSGWSRREMLGSAAALAAAWGCGAGEQPRRRPNILVAYSDDISYPHKSAYGYPAVDTPAFDRVAREGVLFPHSYTAAPSCTPSRSGTLTGQMIWRLREASTLMGAFPPDLPVYPRLLEEAGYFAGYTGKGWGPGDIHALGREKDPAGEPFRERRYEPPRDGLNPIDYAANFRDFLAARPADAPFCFWFGASEAHRRYAKGAGLAAGKKLEAVTVPEFWPDTEEIRSDILDYFVEIEWQDQHLGRMLTMLEEAGELDHTIVIVTSDNGMPFPRAKTTLYDWGTRMPLAIRWGERVPGGRTVTDFVSHTDFAPTLLEAAGVPIPEQMTGRSLLPVLESDQAGRVDPSRDFAVTAVERHTWCRPNGAPYPSRMIRTDDFLYIHNYEPERWPAGDPDFESPHQGIYGDVDDCPAKTFMLENQERFPREFELSFGKRPEEELFEVASDPSNVKNLAAEAAYAEKKAELRERLDNYLSETGDPRSRGEAPWENQPYYWGDFHPDKQG